MITPEQFAEILCDDLDLPSSSFSAAIASSIRQQCEQFSSDMIPDDEEDRRVIIKVHNEFPVMIRLQVCTNERVHFIVLCVARATLKRQ